MFKRFASLGIVLFSTMTAAFGNQVTLKFGNGTYYSPIAGVDVGPYTGTLNGIAVALYCDDLADSIDHGDTFTVNITPLSSADLSNTRFGTLPNASSLYDQIAWLTLQFASHPQTQWVDIHEAIWGYFDSNAEVIAGSTGTAYWQAQALANDHSINLANFEIVTQANVHVAGVTQYQEFLVQTPEPASIGLIGLGLGLVALGAVRRRAGMNETEKDVEVFFPHGFQLFAGQESEIGHGQIVICKLLAEEAYVLSITRYPNIPTSIQKMFESACVSPRLRYRSVSWPFPARLEIPGRQCAASTFGRSAFDGGI